MPSPYSNPLSNQLPVASVSTIVKLPSVDELDQQIAQIQQQLAGLPVNGGRSPATLIRQQLTRKLTSLQQKRLDVASGGFGRTDIPPAPDSPGSFSNQIATPLIGLEDLTIPI
jgi:hypothetical protein